MGREEERETGQWVSGKRVCVPYFLATSSRKLQYPGRNGCRHVLANGVIAAPTPPKLPVFLVEHRSTSQLK